MTFSTYMLHCADDSHYVGHTDNLEQRMSPHDAGEYPGYTRHRRPVTLVWSQDFTTRDEAFAAQRQIKGWSRAKKEALVHEDWPTIQQHAWGTRHPLPAHLA